MAGNVWCASDGDCAVPGQVCLGSNESGSGWMGSEEGVLGCECSTWAGFASDGSGGCTSGPWTLLYGLLPLPGFVVSIWALTRIWSDLKSMKKVQMDLRNPIFRLLIVAAPCMAFNIIYTLGFMLENLVVSSYTNLNKDGEKTSALSLVRIVATGPMVSLMFFSLSSIIRCWLMVSRDIVVALGYFKFYSYEKFIRLSSISECVYAAVLSTTVLFSGLNNTVSVSTPFVFALSIFALFARVVVLKAFNHALQQQMLIERRGLGLESADGGKRSTQNYLNDKDSFAIYSFKRSIRLVHLSSVTFICVLWGLTSNAMAYTLIYDSWRSTCTGEGICTPSVLSTCQTLWMQAATLLIFYYLHFVSKNLTARRKARKTAAGDLQDLQSEMPTKNESDVTILEEDEDRISEITVSAGDNDGSQRMVATAAAASVAPEPGGASFTASKPILD